jgi:hypothetical protein
MSPTRATIGDLAVWWKKRRGVSPAALSRCHWVVIVISAEAGTQG